MERLTDQPARLIKFQTLGSPAPLPSANANVPAHFGHEHPPSPENRFPGEIPFHNELAIAVQWPSIHDESDDAMLAQDNLARVASRNDPMCRYETSIYIMVV
jgi:hypothetical protein